MDDLLLIKEFAKTRSHDAFQELVTRHLPMVLSAAQRLVRDASLAEEIAQSVFSTLARKAHTILPPQIVGGWLYNTTRHLSSHAIRTESRRREREQTAAAMQSLDATLPDSHILEHLEPAMAGLNAEDRDALVLRFLENRSLREVGAEFGISEDAARMRVSRALDRLRVDFEKRGINTTSIVIATAMAAGTISAPAGLSAAISSAALAGLVTATSTGTATAVAAVSQKLWIAALVVVTSVGMYEMRKATQLRRHVRELESRQSLDAAQTAQLTQDRDEATGQLATLRSEHRDELNRNNRELLRLRSELARAKGDRQIDTTPAGAHDPAQSSTNEARVVAQIVITNIGPHWVNQETIRPRIQTRVGEVYNRLTVDKDVRALHATGLFGNVRVIEETTADNAGILLTYLLQDKPTLEPGKYIPKADLVFVGYQTPEASMQSLTWAMITGNWEMTLKAFTPDLAPKEEERGDFDGPARQRAQQFNGMQILARKDLPNDVVELKVAIDAASAEADKPSSRELMIQKLVKVGEEWKLGGSTHSYSPDWDSTGPVQSFTH